MRVLLVPVQCKNCRATDRPLVNLCFETELGRMLQSHPLCEACATAKQKRLMEPKAT